MPTIRPTREEDLPFLADLLDGIFRRSRGIIDQSMLTDFPLVFAPANWRNGRVVYQDDRLVAHAALWRREAVIHGQRLVIGVLVCCGHASGLPPPRLCGRGRDVVASPDGRGRVRFGTSLDRSAGLLSQAELGTGRAPGHYDCASASPLGPRVACGRCHRAVRSAACHSRVRNARARIHPVPTIAARIAAPCWTCRRSTRGWRLGLARSWAISFTRRAATSVGSSNTAENWTPSSLWRATSHAANLRAQSFRCWLTMCGRT